MRPTDIKAMQEYLQGATDIPEPARDAMYRLIDEVKRLASKLAKELSQADPYPK